MGIFQNLHNNKSEFKDFLKNEDTNYKFFKSKNVNKVNPTLLESLNEPFGLDEIQMAINHLRSDPAPGPEGMCIGFYKYTFGNTGNFLLRMYNSMCSSSKFDTVFEYMNQACVIPIAKETEKDKIINIESLRPIALKIMI